MSQQKEIKLLNIRPKTVIMSANFVTFEQNLTSFEILNNF